MEQPVLAIVGPTASGKTSLAVDLQRRLGNLEAINADSRQVYRYMDIGTAKPSREERETLPHWLIDVADPGEPFSLGRWLNLSRKCLGAIWDRGGVPVVVGGTGQYVWALLEGWRVPQVPPQEDFRQEMESRAPEDLLEELRRIDPSSAEFIQPRNVRRVIRALEVFHATGEPFSHWRTRETPAYSTMILGLHVERAELYARIDRRVDAMMAGGFLDEVRALLDRGYTCELPSMSGIGYQELCRHLAEGTPLDESVERIKTRTHRLSRHQNAWFKASDERIRWIEASESASDEATEEVARWLGEHPV